MPAWPAITTPSQHFIGNRWHAPQGRAELPMIDPSDGAPFAAIARGNAADIDAAVRAAQAARAGAWGKLSPAERGRLLGKLSRAILDHAEELALTEARDCGKPLTQARADVAACARYFEFYGGACDKLHGETHSLSRRLHRADVAGAARRHRPHHSVELPAADIRTLGRRRARGRQCVRGQAGGGRVPVGVARGRTRCWRRACRPVR